MIELQAGSRASRRGGTFSGPPPRLWARASTGERLRPDVHTTTTRGNSTAQERSRMVSSRRGRSATMYDCKYPSAPNSAPASLPSQGLFTLLAIWEGRRAQCRAGRRYPLDLHGTVAPRCAYSALVGGRSPIPCGFMRPCSRGNWHFRLKSRGGSLKGAHHRATGCTFLLCEVVKRLPPVAIAGYAEWSETRDASGRWT
jgi:hypothetical protein